MKPAEFATVSDLSGVPEGTIRKIHYGEVPDPRISTVQRLYNHFERQRAPRRQRSRPS